MVAAVDHTGNTTLDMMQATAERTGGGESCDLIAFFKTFAELRPADVRFMINQIVEDMERSIAPFINANSIGIVGHSFGGWTALMVTTQDCRLGATVALVPAGGRTPLPTEVVRNWIDLHWKRDVSTLFIVAGRDSILPLEGVRELFKATYRFLGEGQHATGKVPARLFCSVSQGKIFLLCLELFSHLLIPAQFSSHK